MAIQDDTSFADVAAPVEGGVGDLADSAGSSVSSLTGNALGGVATSIFGTVEQTISLSTTNKVVDYNDQLARETLGRPSKVARIGVYSDLYPGLQSVTQDVTASQANPNFDPNNKWQFYKDAERESKIIKQDSAAELDVIARRQEVILNDPNISEEKRKQLFDKEEAKAKPLKKKYSQASDEEGQLSALKDSEFNSSFAASPVQVRISDIGVRAAVSKRSRDNYLKKAFMYFSEEDRKKVKVAFDLMDQTARTEFLGMFFMDSSYDPEIGVIKDVDPAFPTDDVTGVPRAAYGNFPGYQESGAFIRFMLMSVDESFREKSQIVSLLQDNYVPYFFGSEPTIIRFSGVLINSVHDQWKYWFLMFYHRVIKASRLAELPGSPVLQIYYEDTRVSGYPLDLSISHSVADDTALTFSMSFLVKEYSVERDLDSNQIFNSQFITEVPLPARLYDELQQFVISQPQFPKTGIPLLDAAIEAVAEFVGDAVNDAIVLTGAEAASDTTQNAINSNLNPAVFEENFVNDPVGTIRKTPNDVASSKADVAITKDLVKDAKSNPNRVKEDTINNNVVIGPAAQAVR